MTTSKEVTNTKNHKTQGQTDSKKGRYQTRPS